MQMIRVGKLNLAANFLQVMGADAAFDGPLRPNVHEYRSLDCAPVGAGELAPPCAALLFDDFKHEWLLF